MPTADTWAQGLLDLTFINTDFAGLGDAGGIRGSVAAGSIYAGLATADPGASGTQLTSEATFGSYARVAVARSGSGWTRSGTTISNVASITFPTSTSGSNVVSYATLGTASSGAGKLMYSGALSISKTIASGDTASYAIGALTVSQA